MFPYQYDFRRKLSRLFSLQSPTFNRDFYSSVLLFLTMNLKMRSRRVLEPVNRHKFSILALLLVKVKNCYESDDVSYLEEYAIKTNERSKSTYAMK